MVITTKLTIDAENDDHKMLKMLLKTLNAYKLLLTQSPCSRSSIGTTTLWLEIDSNTNTEHTPTERRRGLVTTFSAYRVYAYAEWISLKNWLQHPVGFDHFTGFCYIHLI